MTAQPPDDVSAAAAPPAGPAPERDRPGARTFTIEGRAAPGLFVFGWLATLLGIGALVVAIMGGNGRGFPWALLIGLVLLSLGLVAGAGGQAIERKARGGRAYVGPSPFLVFAAAIPIISLVGLGLGAIVTAVGLSIDSPIVRLVALVLQGVVYIGLIRLLVVDTGALTWSGMGVRRPTRGSIAEFTLGALWAVPVIAVTVIVTLVVGLVTPAQPGSPLPPAGELGGFVLNLLAGAIAAPIGEEILFRGFATTAWLADMERWRALIRGGIFFAAVHVLGITGTEAGPAIAVAFVAFAVRVPVGIALGYLFAQTRSIWAPLGLHATFNAILIILAEVATRTGQV